MHSRTARSASRAALGLVVLWGCGQGAAREEVTLPSAGVSVAAPPETIAARELCQLFYGDLGKQLEAECPAVPETRDSAARTSRTSALRDANEKCMIQLEASVVSGRLQLLKVPAEACAASLRAAYREGVPLRAPIDLAGLEGCAAVFLGELSAGSACRTALECKSPLVCKAPDGVDKPFEGTCSGPAAAGEACWPSNEAILLGARASCGEGLYCPGTPSVGSSSIGLADVGLIGHGMGTGYGGGNVLGLGGASTIGGASSATRGRAPTVKMGATTVNGRLPPEVIQRIVRQYFGRFRACYEKGLTAKPDLEGTVTVKFVIDQAGAVKSLADAGSTLPDPEVGTCVRNAFQQLSFPQPENGKVTVTYPVHFAPGKSKSPAADAPADVEPSVADGPWTARAPKAGVCRVRAAKGQSCLATDGCARGLACVGHTCVEPSGGQAADCQSDHDCSIWQRCALSGFSPAHASFGLCRDRKPGKEPCLGDSECRGECLHGECAALCTEK